jgi:hypothetical protein
MSGRSTALGRGRKHKPGAIAYRKLVAVVRFARETRRFIRSTVPRDGRVWRLCDRRVDCSQSIGQRHPPPFACGAIDTVARHCAAYRSSER